MVRDFAQALSFVDDAISKASNEFAAARMRWLRRFILETRTQKMSREKMPSRRTNVTTTVQWSIRGMPEHKLHVTFGFVDGKVREAFCAGFRADTQMCALANDACILLSRLLQHGEDVADIAPTLGEDRQEGEVQGPPASIIGAIALRAVEIQEEVKRK